MADKTIIDVYEGDNKQKSGEIEVTDTATTYTGSGIQWFRQRQIISGFVLWMNTGLQPTKGVRIFKLVKETFGLRVSSPKAAFYELRKITVDCNFYSNEWWNKQEAILKEKGKL